MQQNNVNDNGTNGQGDKHVDKRPAQRAVGGYVFMGDGPEMFILFDNVVINNGDRFVYKNGVLYKDE